MPSEKNIWLITFILASVAGYCDTVTFVSANELFSAHVTGNFIVFAYDIIKGSDVSAWIKLITLPVFIASVISGGYINDKTESKYFLLLAEGILLLISGIAAIGLKAGIFSDQQLVMYTIVMIIVFAMGFQNTFGKLFSKETHGPTTMMTGNVTQASLDLGNILRAKFSDTSISLSFKKQLTTIGGFLVGCLSGAIIANKLGLASVILPGVILIYCCYRTGKLEENAKIIAANNDNKM